MRSKKVVSRIAILDPDEQREILESEWVQRGSPMGTLLINVFHFSFYYVTQILIIKISFF